MMKKLVVILFPILFLLPNLSQAQEKTRTKIGSISSLRVNEVGIVYGPPADNIKAEVIVNFPGDKNAYGFQLRQDGNEITHAGMLNLLRDAFANNFKVKLTHKIKDGSTKGRVIVVELIK